jgi:hypothetical protein
MKHLKSEEWYPWRRRSDKKYPWERYLNTDFLKSERERINDVAAWTKKFQRGPYHAPLEDVCYYVLPIEIKSRWLTYLEEGHTECKGLSALRNCSVEPLVAFFPSGRAPRDYTPIRINSSKKIALLNSYTKSTFVQNAITIEDWDVLEIDFIYADVRTESNFVSRIIEENTNTEESMAKSIAAPLISAPFVLGGIGGISSASILDERELSHGLNIALQMMLPPEYRSFLPPKSGIKGKKIEILEGISIHLAEKILTGRNYVRSVEGPNFGIMELERSKRAAFRGEYSILGALINSQSRGIELYEELIHKFFESEICIPNLGEQVDADGVLNLIEAIDEDSGLQIASLRQRNPAIRISVQEEENFRRLINADIDVVLTERIRDDGLRDIITEMKVDACVENLKREAQSIARSENRDCADLTALEQARRTFKDRLWMLEDDERFRNIRYNARAERGRIRVSILKNTLRELRIATAEEIYQKVNSNTAARTFFRDFEDLKQLLIWAERNYTVYRDSRMRYGLV